MTLVGMMAVTPMPAQQQNANGTFTLKIQSDIVLTNVVVRDKKTGAVVKGLKASDFTIMENGKPQKIASFDFQNVDEAAVLNEKTTVTGKATIADLLNKNIASDTAGLKDHRLIVMFFDLSSMQPEDVDRAVEAAQNYINKKMQPADLVALVSLDTSLSMDQDFTADKAALLKGVGRYNGTEGTGLASGNEGGSSGGTADDASSFTADDSEYNALNTDRELYAIQSIAKSLERVDQRKSLLYFSGGLDAAGHRKSGEHARGHQRGGARQHGHLQRRFARTDGDAAGRECFDRQPARHGRLQRRIDAEQPRRELRLAGDAGHFVQRHRRKSVLRLE